MGDVNAPSLGDVVAPCGCVDLKKIMEEPHNDLSIRFSSGDILYIISKDEEGKQMPRLALWSGNNLTGRRILFTGGDGVAVRNLRAFRFNNLLSSFSLSNPGDSSEVTLVLFSGINYQGSYRVFRGAQIVRNLRNRSFNNVTSSFILLDEILTNTQIERIQRTGNIPEDIVIIRQ